MNIAAFIKELRKKRQISQEEIANLLGLTRQTYSQIENGERDLTIPEAQKIADIFNMSLSDLIRSKENEIEVILEKKKNTSHKKSSEIRENRPQITVDPERVEKFKQALLYLLDKVGAKSNVGQTVIYKLLYFIDFDFYEKYEEQLIGATYIKNHFGPTPIEFKKIVDEMIDDEMIESYKSKHYQHEQKKYLPLVVPNLELFTGKEIKHIDETLEKYADKSATWLSAYSHLDIPWIMTEDREPIEYEAVFYRGPETSVRVYEDEETEV